MYKELKNSVLKEIGMKKGIIAISIGLLMMAYINAKNVKHDIGKSVNEKKKMDYSREYKSYEKEIRIFKDI